MQPMPTRWACEPYEPAAGERLAAGLGVSCVVGSILARRGFVDVAEARRFLAAEERHDPFALAGVPAASRLILAHLGRGSRIAVFGDYDVDGVCSTAMLVRTLRALGGDPVWELPSRFDDGYGLSTGAVERLAARGVRLLVTVDCGVTAVESVAAARAAGLDVVITDHHRPGPDLPDCVVVHPALSAYGCPELCASGVVLKLSEALHAGAGNDPRAADEDVDLAALATVCDLVPLRDENRRIVREGLVALSRTRKPGPRALMAVAGVAPAELTEHHLGFRLGPRINAAGRMRRADAALELLLTEDEGRAEEVARELDLLNRDRQEAETRILFAADEACAPQASRAALVVAGEGWHPGVVGIVASRLVERWRRPSVAIALDDDGGGRGSGRSISAYDLLAGLEACGQHLSRFGGHRMAAGVELEPGAVEPFRRALAAHAGGSLAPGDLIARERVDAVVPGGVLGLELADDLERLRPFGMGNPQPTLLVPAARFEQVVGMGEENEHARFTLVTAGGARSRGVAFRSAPQTLAPAQAGPHDIAMRLERNRWNGMVEPRVILRALCPTEAGELRVIGEDAPFWERFFGALAREAASGREEATGREPPVREARAGEAAALADLSGSASAEATHIGDIHGRREPVDRRCEGFAGVAGDLFTSGEAVLVAVADVPRRRNGLERIVAGLAPGGVAVAAWGAIEADPRVAAGFDHLVALDPPPGGVGDPLLCCGPRAHLAWGPAEAEFALLVWRAELDLRPALAQAYRGVRDLPPEADPELLRGALCGSGRYPRAPEQCARLAHVLGELGLMDITPDPVRAHVHATARMQLESASGYRRSRERLARIERALGAETRPLAPARAA